MYRRFPIRIGVEYPSPTSIFHFLVSSSGQAFGSVNDATTPSRFGPRHCGQSEVRPCAAAAALKPAMTATLKMMRFMISA
jgi:hypothetical protein